LIADKAIVVLINSKGIIGSPHSELKHEETGRRRREEVDRPTLALKVVVPYWVKRVTIGRREVGKHWKEKYTAFRVGRKSEKKKSRKSHCSRGNAMHYLQRG
jgi:hypothetical protein